MIGLGAWCARSGCNVAQPGGTLTLALSRRERGFWFGAVIPALFQRERE
jgi:hypothetical protein